ncbi:MAG: outer membrane beta-barrel protein [Deltaproteobacteria bacterium]|nr:outer membrane beta-barrel protein [Deltaproteobacteria bacterium]
MKKIAVALFTFSTLMTSSAHAVGNFSVGLGPVGNVYIVDARPELDPGVGGILYFDYRWTPQISTQFGVLVTTEDGTGISNGDNGIEFLGIPTFDLKFFVLSSPSRWDPYALIGLGVYAVSEGSVNNGTVAVGVGANVGIGTDYYLTENLSLGFAGVYRSIGLIDSTSGANNGTALFPFSLMGNVAWHW